MERAEAGAGRQWWEVVRVVRVLAEADEAVVVVAALVSAVVAVAVVVCDSNAIYRQLVVVECAAVDAL